MPPKTMVSLDGTLIYRARSDGSPYSVINQARGTYTKLPDDGDKVDCGDVFYRVDDNPVLVLCGTVPTYRDLHSGDVGNDVRQLNQNLHELGYAAAAGVNIDSNANDFTWMTEKALEVLQHDKGFDVTGELDIDDAVFLPESVRIAQVTGELGGSAQPAAQVLYATSDTPEVQMDLDASQQGEVGKGDPAQITLPGNKSVTGKMDRFGRVTQGPAGQNNNAGDATIPAYISLDDPEEARGLDKTPVQVEITTEGVESALSVPVTALVGKSGGGLRSPGPSSGVRRIGHGAHPRARRRRRHHHHDHARCGHRRSVALPDSGAGRPGGLRYRPRSRRPCGALGRCGGRRERCYECQGRTIEAKGRAAGGECRAARPAAARRAVRARGRDRNSRDRGVLGLSSSSQAGLLAELDRLGTNMLTAEAGQSLTGGAAQLPLEAPARITHLDNVQLVAHPLMKEEKVYRNSMIPEGNTGGLQVRATSLNLEAVLSTGVARGNWLNEGTAREPVAVLGSAAAQRLGIDRVHPDQRIWLGDQ